MCDLFFHPSNAYVQAGAFPYKQGASANQQPHDFRRSDQIIAGLHPFVIHSFRGKSFKNNEKRNYFKKIKKYFNARYHFQWNLLRYSMKD